MCPRPPGPARRRVLAGLAGLGVGSLAGCSADESPPTDDGASSPPASADATETTRSPPSDLGSAPVGPWPQTRADAANTGTSDAPGPTADPSLRWTARAAGAVGAAVGAGGAGVAVVTDDGRVVLLGSGGRPRWAATVGVGRFPAGVGDEYVVVPGHDRVVAFDAASGDRLRAVPTPGGPLFAPTLAGSRAYVGTFSDGVLAVDLSDGTVVWRGAEKTRAYPPTVADGVAYVTARDPGGRGAGHLVALDTETGDERWRTALDGNPTAPPGYRDGVVYAGTHRGSVYAVDAASGDERWRESVGDWVTRGPTTAGDGVYAATLGEGVVSLAHDGAVRWRTDVSAGTNPRLTPDLAVLGGDGGVVALDRADGGVRWRIETDGNVQYDVEVVDGTVYAGDRVGNAYAVDATSGDRRWTRPFKPTTLPGPVVGPRTVAGGSRTGATYGLLAIDGTETLSVGHGGRASVTPAVVGDDAASASLLGCDTAGYAFRVRVRDYGETPAGRLPPTPTPDPERTSTATVHVDFGRPEFRWESTLDDPFRSPVSVSDGRWYAGTNRGVSALDPSNGSTLWHRDLGGSVEGAPAVAGGAVYAATRAGKLVALDPADGAVSWDVSLDGAVRAGPAVRDGRVVVGTGAGSVVAVGADGAESWRRSVGGGVVGGAALAADRVVVGTAAGDVVALAPESGTEVWRRATEGAVHATPAVGGDVVYVGSRDRHLYALSVDDGRVRFRVRLRDWVDAPPAVGHGAVFVADQSGRVYAVVGE
jgi:outer membrane protein assembly factor BamB